MTTLLRKGSTIKFILYVILSAIIVLEKNGKSEIVIHVKVKSGKQICLNIYKKIKMLL